MRVHHIEQQNIESLEKLNQQRRDEECWALVSYQRDQELRRFHHDMAAALRSFKYLSRETRGRITDSSPMNQRKIQVLEENMATLERLQRFVQQVLKIDG